MEIILNSEIARLVLGKIVYLKKLQQQLENLFELDFQDTFTA